VTIVANTPETLRLQRDGGVLTITLSRPTLKNAIDEDMVVGLYRTLRDAAHDKTVATVVLEGDGNAFCSGADLKDMAKVDVLSRKYPSEVVLRLGAESALLLHEMPKPTVAKIRGPAVGGGLALALACDFRLADDSAKLAYAHTKVALSGDFAAAYFLTKWMGAGKAREFCLLNPTYDAQESFQRGLLSKVCNAETLDEEVLSLAKRLESGPTEAYGSIKDNLRHAEAFDRDAYIASELRNFLRCRNSEEHREALSAFLEKREPDFRRVSSQS